jgi:hypothetical protein
LVETENTIFSRDETDQPTNRPTNILLHFLTSIDPLPFPLLLFALLAGRRSDSSCFCSRSVRLVSCFRSRSVRPALAFCSSGLRSLYSPGLRSLFVRPSLSVCPAFVSVRPAFVSGLLVLLGLHLAFYFSQPLGLPVSRFRPSVLSASVLLFLYFRAALIVFRSALFGLPLLSFGLLISSHGLQCLAVSFYFLLVLFSADNTKNVKALNLNLNCFYNFYFIAPARCLNPKFNNGLRKLV